jgi:hypothetical protein
MGIGYIESFQMPKTKPDGRLSLHGFDSVESKCGETLIACHRWPQKWSKKKEASIGYAGAAGRHREEKKIQNEGEHLSLDSLSSCS